MTDTLQPGQSLLPGGMLVSRSGEYRWIFQPDGNLVLNRGPTPIWSPGTNGRGAVRLDMQGDGNLVLYDAQNHPVWHTGTQGRPGSRAVLQDDGNLVVYERTTPYWQSRTWGGTYHEEQTWLEGALETFETPFVVVASNVATGAAAVTDAVGSIPLVGPALHGVFVIASGPFKFTDQVMQGQRIDRALVNDFKDKIAGVKEVAPYAQTVVSLVPGIGSGAAAAIGAGLALAQGKPIDEAIVEGVRGAIPGGPVAQAAFDITYAAATGQNIVEAAGQTAARQLGLPPQAAQAFNVIYRAAQGENIPLAILDQARGYMPTPEAQKAFDVGLALAHGKRLQDAAVQELSNLAPAQMNRLRDAAAPILQNSPAVRMVQTFLANPVVESGYRLGVGLASHSGVGEVAVKAVRAKLIPEERKGFDAGVASFQATKAGKVPSAISKDPNATAGYVLAKGLRDYPDARVKAELLQTAMRDPRGKIGVAYAKREELYRRGFFSWLWHLVAG